MPYDHQAEARRARAGVLAGHGRLTTPVRAVPTTRVKPFPSDKPHPSTLIEQACSRHPEYQRDGTRQMLEAWLRDGQADRVRWYCSRC